MHFLFHFTIRGITCFKPQKVLKIILDLQLNLRVSIFNGKNLFLHWFLFGSLTFSDSTGSVPLNDIKWHKGYQMPKSVNNCQTEQNKASPKILLIVTFSIARLLNTVDQGKYVTMYACPHIVGRSTVEAFFYLLDQNAQQNLWKKIILYFLHLSLV